MAEVLGRGLRDECSGEVPLDALWSERGCNYGMAGGRREEGEGREEGGRGVVVICSEFMGS